MKWLLQASRQVQVQTILGALKRWFMEEPVLSGPICLILVLAHLRENKTQEHLFPRRPSFVKNRPPRVTAFLTNIFLLSSVK